MTVVDLFIVIYCSIFSSLFVTWIHIQLEKVTDRDSRTAKILSFTGPATIIGAPALVAWSLLT